MKKNVILSFNEFVNEGKSSYDDDLEDGEFAMFSEKGGKLVGKALEETKKWILKNKEIKELIQEEDNEAAVGELICKFLSPKIKKIQRSHDEVTDSDVREEMAMFIDEVLNDLEDYDYEDLVLNCL